MGSEKLFLTFPGTLEAADHTLRTTVLRGHGALSGDTGEAV